MITTRPKARPVGERFWSKVKIANESDRNSCWLWTGCTNLRGYGRFNVGYHTELAHRVAYVLAFGRIPTLDVLHDCDVPACVRPDHLTEGTQQDNVIDAVTKLRMGKKLTPELAAAVKSDYAEQDHKRYGRLVRIATKYGIDRSQVWKIGTGRDWQGLR